MIYISEAHASDEWKLGNIVDIPQHKTLEDRIKAAKNFVQTYEWNIPTVVDSFYENEASVSFEQIYSAWPERFYVFHYGSVADIGLASNEYGFDRLSLKRIIRTYVPERSQDSLLSSSFNIYKDDDESICVHSDVSYEFVGDETPFIPSNATVGQI